MCHALAYHQRTCRILATILNVANALISRLNAQCE
jgi:hypothetical protein